MGEAIHRHRQERRYRESAMSSPIIKAQRSPDWLQVLIGGLIIALGDTIFASTLWFGWSGAGLIKP